MWIFQNTFASTETQRHVKPLRMIDEVCFEMANKRGMQQWKNWKLKCSLRLSYLWRIFWN